MLKDLKKSERRKTAAIKYGIALVAGSLAALASSSFLLGCLAYAKPIF